MVKRIITSFILLLLAGAIGTEVIFSASPEDLGVTFLDVGQGDAILIEVKGKNILVDGGPDRKIIRELSEHLGFGERDLDVVVLTHPHSDHLRGLNSVLERFDVKRVLLPPMESKTPAFKYFVKESRQQDVLMSRITAPYQVKIADGCSLNFLHPFPGLQTQDANNISLVSRLRCSGLSFLFTGDIEKEVQETLLERGVDINSDVLKVPHHGSADAGSEEFFQEVSPEVAVISVGKDNKMGHPSLRTIRKLQREDALVVRTDKRGAIQIRKSQEQWKIIPEK